MITILIVCSLGWISGCASNKPMPPTPVEQELILDKQIHSLSRNEVITAVRECETTGLRAVMMYGKRKNLRNWLKSYNQTPMLVMSFLMLKLLTSDSGL